MDELKLMTITGGSDLFDAGTYKVSDDTLPHPIKAITGYASGVVTSMRHRLPGSVNKTSTITISGSNGTANISYGADLLSLPFVTDLYNTAISFVSAYASRLAQGGVTLSHSTQAQVETLTLTGTSGTATIAGAGGLTLLASFVDDLATTAAGFVTTNAAAYLLQQIILTSDGADLIFTSAIPGVSFTAPTITPGDTDLDGSVAHTTANLNALVFTSTRVLFPTPTIANVDGTINGLIATTGADGLVASSQEFLTTTLVDGIDLFMEYPVEEIVIGGGSVVLHFIK